MTLRQKRILTKIQALIQTLYKRRKVISMIPLHTHNERAFSLRHVLSTLTLIHAILRCFLASPILLRFLALLCNLYFLPYLAKSSQ